MKFNEKNQRQGSTAGFMHIDERMIFTNLSLGSQAA